MALPRKTSSRQIRVLVADDHELIREGVRSCLASASHIQIVGEATNGLEAVQMAEELQPDLVVMDIHMPKMNGLEATQAILQHSSQIHILILSIYDRKEYILQFIDSGAKGYLLKDTNLHQVVQAIDSIMAGDAFFSPSISRQLLQEMQQRRLGENVIALTPREVEVACRIALGLSTQEMARELGVAVSTIKRHRANLLAKLGTSSSVDVTRYVLQRGWIRPDEVSF